MFNLKFSGVEASQLQEPFNPECHRIIQPGEPVEAGFVQRILDKYASEVKAYAITQFGCTYVVELQFVDSAVGNQCNTEYVRGWRKGGEVATKKKAACRKAQKRLRCNRMYILPDGTEFFYYCKWDGHGNLMGKVRDESNVSPPEGFVQLTNRIVHRTILEQADLVPEGEERFRL